MKGGCYIDGTETFEHNRILVWGALGTGRLAIDLVRRRGGEVIGVVDSAGSDVTDVAGAPFLGQPKIVSDFLLGFDREMLRTLGGIVAFAGHQGRARLRAQESLKSMGLPVISCVDDRSHILGAVDIKEGCLVFGGAVLGPDVQLGNGVIVNQGASVGHDCVLGAGSHVANGAVISGYVKLGVNVLIGAGSVILPRLSIGDDAVIGAGSVVTRSVGPNITVAGNPARALNA